MCHLRKDRFAALRRASTLLVSAALCATFAIGSRPTWAQGSTGKPAGDPIAKIQKQVDQMGADIALVVVPTATVRSKPATTSAAIATVPRGSALALVNRTKNGPFYNVIHIQSGKEGWVSATDVRAFLTKNKKQQSLFQASRTRGNQNPEVVIANKTVKEMNLKIGETRFVIPANTKKAVVLPAGSHAYYASAPGVMPAFGSRAFEKGYSYTWSFSIHTVRR
jgi:hypothetical protein